MLLLKILNLTSEEFFSWIPAASLAAVIMAAVGTMFDFNSMKKIYQTSKTDFVTMLTTFITAFFGEFVRIIS